MLQSNKNNQLPVYMAINTLLQAILMAKMAAGSPNTSRLAPIAPPNSKCRLTEYLALLIINCKYRHKRATE